MNLFIHNTIPLFGHLRQWCVLSSTGGLFEALFVHPAFLPALPLSVSPLLFSHLAVSQPSVIMTSETNRGPTDEPTRRGE